VLLANRYELGERIGLGGMGQVWEARDTLLGRRVAVKTVILSDPTDRDTPARILREASATASLSHPGIVTVYDAGTDEDAPAGPTAFIVMELLDGTTLRDTLERGPLPVGEALRIGAAVADALTAAHEIGVIHRDIKPANIIVSGERVTVVDFGIAALTQTGDPTLARPGSTLGTAAYMAPEQAAGRPVCPASDVYALGCVLYALLTGTPPFTGEHYLAVLQQQAFAEPPLLTERRPDAPADVEHLLSRMLAKDPAARPGAAEVASRLRLLAADPDIAAPTLTFALPIAPVDDATATLPAVAAPAASAVAAPAALPAVAAPDGRCGRHRWRARALAVAAIVAMAAVGYVLGHREGAVMAEPIRVAVATDAPATPTDTPATPTDAPAGPSAVPAMTPGSGETAGTSVEDAVTRLSGLVASLPVEDSDGKRSLTARLAAVQEAVNGPAAKLDQRLRDFTRRVDELERADRLPGPVAAALRSATEAVAAAARLDDR